MSLKIRKIVFLFTIFCGVSSWSATFESLDVIENRAGVTYNDISIGNGNTSLPNNEIAIAAWNAGTTVGDAYLLSKSTGSWAVSNVCQTGMSGKKFVGIAIGDVDSGNIGAEVITIADAAAEEYNFSCAIPGWKAVVMMAPSNGQFTDGAIGEISNSQVGNEVVLTSLNTPGVGGGGLFAVNYDSPYHVDGSSKPGGAGSWWGGAVSGQMGHANKGYKAVDIGNVKSGTWTGNEIAVVTNEPGAGVFEIHNMQLGIGGVGDYAGGMIGMPAGKELWNAEIGDIDAGRNGNEVSIGSSVYGTGGNIEVVNYDDITNWTNDVMPSAGVIKNNTIATGILGDDAYESEVVGGMNDLVIRWKDTAGIWNYHVLESGYGSYSAVAIGDINGDLLNDVVFARSSGVLGTYVSVPEPTTISLIFFGTIAVLKRKKKLISNEF